MTNGLYFEDAHVGQVFTSGTQAVTAERIKSFGAEFDPQPQHLDEETAKTSPFGELVASGWHTGAVTLGLMIRGRAPGWAGALGAGLERLSWPTPVRPGDMLRVETEILEMRPSRSRPDRGVVKLRSTTRNQRGEPVMVMTHTILVLRRPATPPPA